MAYTSNLYTTHCIGAPSVVSNPHFILVHLVHCGLKIIEIAAYLAARVFNEGHSFILRIMSMLDIIGSQSKSYAVDNDNRRVTRQEHRSLLEIKEARKARREQLLMENELYEEAEGLLYGSGITD